MTLGTIQAAVTFPGVHQMSLESRQLQVELLPRQGSYWSCQKLTKIALARGFTHNDHHCVPETVRKQENEQLVYLERHLVGCTFCLKWKRANMRVTPKACTRL